MKSENNQRKGKRFHPPQSPNPGGGGGGIEPAIACRHWYPLCRLRHE